MSGRFFYSRPSELALRKIRTSINQPYPIWAAVNCHVPPPLTYSRRKLFGEIRKFKKDNHWHSAWTLDGQLFIKKSQEEQPKIIHLGVVNR